MLVLTRKCQEKIRIGDRVCVTVFHIKGKAVRLGIEAPADVRILRGELVFDHEMASEPKELAFDGTESSDVFTTAPPK
jgi:carbon storage regulator CsrA